MPQPAGSRLGVYEIVASIGAGGMGEVYRARDTRLDRIVAIKVLPGDFSSDGLMRARLEREAKVISSLSHPNICTLHDIGQQNGVDFLVMEYLEGDSLADRLGRGALPLPQVLRYGIEIAEALDAAHRKGVVHRDLKPGNIMLTKSGVKLLDFGLAKSSAAELDPENASQIATQRAALTTEGTIVGTIPYMAPEQIEGMAADVRSDIFALGATLYEMVTGRRAFQGKSRASLMVAILEHEPPAIPETESVAPASLQRLIRVCLAKDPDQRWQSARDVAHLLRGIAEAGPAGPAGSAAAAPAASRRREVAAWIVAGLATVAAAGLALFAPARSAPPSLTSFSVTPPPAYRFRDLAIAPDGRAVVFSANADTAGGPLWVRDLASLESRPLPGTERGDNPFWSPDSRWIAFFARQRLWKIAAAGSSGSPQEICAADFGAGGVWEKDGTILFSMRFGEGLFRVPAKGGEAVRVTTLNASRKESMHGWPQFLAGGRHFLYVARTTGGEKNQIYLGDLQGGEPKPLAKVDSLAGVHGDSMLFVRETALYVQRLNIGSAALEGEAQRLFENVAYSEPWARAFASVSANGSLAYLPVPSARTEFRWYDRTGRASDVVFEDVESDEPRLSPDGRSILFRRYTPAKGATDVWILDLDRGVRTRVTAGLANNGHSAWSPDGRDVVFSSDSDGLYDLYMKPADGSAPERLLWRSTFDKQVLDWSPDGRLMLVWSRDPARKEVLWLFPVDKSSEPRPLIQDESRLSGRFSPDGRYVVHSGDRSEADEIYIREIASGRSVQVSVRGGTRPRWSGDGSEIFFVGPDKTIMSAALDRSSGFPKPGIPAPLFKLGKNEASGYAPSLDGQRFLMPTLANPAEAIRPLHLVAGWPALLKEAE